MWDVSESCLDEPTITITALSAHSHSSSAASKAEGRCCSVTTTQNILRSIIYLQLAQGIQCSRKEPKSKSLNHESHVRQSTTTPTRSEIRRGGVLQHRSSLRDVFPAAASIYSRAPNTVVPSLLDTTIKHPPRCPPHQSISLETRLPSTSSLTNSRCVCQSSGRSANVWGPDC